MFGAVGAFSWSGGLEEKVPELNASFINASTVEDMDNSYLGNKPSIHLFTHSSLYLSN